MPGWVCLSVRKIGLIQASNQLTQEDTMWSMQLRQVGRHLSYEQACLNADKTAELRDIKDDYQSVKDNRPDTKSDSYEKWQQDYADAKEEYEAKKQDVMDYYDDYEAELEQEAEDEQTHIQTMMSTIEAQLEAVKNELEQVDSALQSAAEDASVHLS